MNNDLIYQVNQTPPIKSNIFFALQQVMAIITATMLVPALADASGVYLSQSAALIGAGVGTVVYLLFTQFKSPVFLGSSFTFILPLTTAVSYGYFGIILGSLLAGLVYVMLALIIKFVGANWINKIMPPLIIGPVVALIGFNLAKSAMENLMNTANDGNYSLIAILVGVITFFIVMIVSTKGKKSLKMFPFIVGIIGGYVLASIFTVIGLIAHVNELVIIDFSLFKCVADISNWLPNITMVGLINEGVSKITSFGDVVSIFVAFVPVAIVSFAEHIADHKNIGSIIGNDLLKNPGLHRTLLGDGVGTMFGAIIGGCPTTTYGESIGCVALSKNASTKTILLASIMCVFIAFIYPVVVFIETIPPCVIGGVCIALYGFISVSGLRMIKDIDLNKSNNIFVIASIFICGIGGLEIKFGSVVIPALACALVIGILANLVLNTKRNNNQNNISENSNLIEGDKTVQNFKDEQSWLMNAYMI